MASVAESQNSLKIEQTSQQSTPDEPNYFSQLTDNLLSAIVKLNCRLNEVDDLGIFREFSKRLVRIALEVKLGYFHKAFVHLVDLVKPFQPTTQPPTLRTSIQGILEEPPVLNV